ncbi:MAG: 2-oxoacid:ferredoxin oxidoreductase subunit beta, partial [Candidatus Brocadia sapporoensis]|nr:2-oxoacid:ferredoxin oxidoreductase subunit beta [Candidatus Brocadia sapporoensis]
ATAVATGVKLANPELCVWVTAGDGDLMSIGGNHFIHLLRRNLDINIILFNNKIYGLTKGQYSPTSELGKVTKSTPFGSLDYPVNPISLALGAKSTFSARAMDRDPKHLQEMIVRCCEHKGTSFLEVFQNCNIFNDGAFALYTEKDTRDDHVLYLENGKPMIFGKQKNLGIKLDGMKPIIIDINKDGNSINDVVVHNEKSRELAFVLSEFAEHPEFPAPMGVFLDIERETFEERLTAQTNLVKEREGEKDFDTLLRGSSTWEIN